MSGAQTSTFYPVNQLLVDNAQQIQNTYAPQRNELFVQQTKQTIGASQLDHVSRAAAAVDALPLDQQPAAWQAGGEQLVQMGIIPSFQPYPGPERVKQLAGMGMSVENQFKLRGAQNTPDIYGVGGGGQPGASGAPHVAPVGGGFTGDREKDRALIVKQESGGDPTVLNYVARQDPTAYARGATASGKYQFVNSTWREGLALAGIDPSQYPTAREAPEAVQDKVFDAVYGKYGTKPWEKGAKDWVRDEHGNYQLATVRPPAGSPGGAPAAPGTPAPYQVATTGAIPPPPGAPPGAVAPVAAPGAPSVPGAPPAAPVAAPAPAAAPAAMPPELQTDATRLTPQDKRELAPILARVRAGQVPYETYQNEVQQRQAANVARQDKWQAQQVAAQQHAQTAADAAARLELSRKADARAEAEAAQKAKDAGETYVPGTGIEAVHENTVQKYAAKVAKGQQLTDDEQRLYDGAYYALQQTGGQTGVMTDPNNPGQQIPFQTTRRLSPSLPEPKGGALPAVISQPGAAKKEAVSTEQSKAAGFADRVQQALPIIEDTSPAAMNRWQQLLGKAPIVGNSLVTPEFQMHMQAERNFINAVLRRESGMAIGVDEFVNARQQYIPQPGDSPQVLAQKKQNRETQLAGIIRDAGPSYKPQAASGTVAPAPAAGGWTVKRID